MEANGRDTGIAVVDQQRQRVALLRQRGRGVDQVVAVVAQSLDISVKKNIGDPPV